MNKKEIIKKIEEMIEKNLKQIVGIPDYLIPKVNIPNECAYPYLEVENNGTIFLVIRERGIEYERDICLDINDSIYKIFEKITFELAINEEKSNVNYSLERIKEKQKELMKLIVYLT
ncbi:Imm63 family immunity protein [Chryseobacterium sp. SL1]|uniref:Imm63 family immunity protein n=1 Tax=Chryseobacterium sp. SL1 TaxID=2995159 RepID=UPI00227537C7|nr:Imm63 family immunity protein [Chryseobacterium sp. SL1]MCY1660773.1 hypothetical protein [Chryseobacterium sp. SL1]